MISNNDKKATDQKERGEEIKIYGAPGSSLQTPEEHQHDQSVDPRKGGTINVSNDDLRETDIDKMNEIQDGNLGNAGDIDDAPTANAD